MAEKLIYPNQIEEKINKKLIVTDALVILGLSVGIAGAEGLMLWLMGANLGLGHIAIAVVLAAVGRAGFRRGVRSKKNMEWLVEKPINGPVRIKEP